jgi:glycerol-1-phosphate dehydrogenase [NAD(P)+]
MTSAITFDPTDLSSFYAQVSAISGRDRTLRLSDVRVGPQLLSDPARAVDFNASVGQESTVVVCDDTEILRDGEPLKPAFLAALSAAGIIHTVVELSGQHEIHTTPDHIETVRKNLSPSTAVIALGSGTVADITKHAVYEFEEQSGHSLDLTVVQTANSVCAFTSGLAVVTTDGVKRTVPSRLPDHLVLDTTVLAQAPREYTLGGIGDSSVAASSIADYRLANMLGVGGWEPVSWRVVETGRSKLLAHDPVLADTGISGAESLALDLSTCGLSMTFAGESAPLSGLEHVTSHMLDLSAEHFGREVGNHGSQCGLATALVLIAFDELMNSVDVATAEPRFLSKGLDLGAEEQSVRDAFGPIDASGAVWKECWSDYRKKLDVWNSSEEAVAHFQSDWTTHRSELLSYLTTPEQFMAALAATGHPLHFENVTPGIPEDQARWAFAHARLMRKRISIADVLYFFGAWDDEFVTRVFDRFHSIRETILNQTSEGAQP